MDKRLLKILEDNKTIKDLSNEELISIMEDGNITSQMYITLEQELIKRLKGE